MLGVEVLAAEARLDAVAPCGGVLEVC